jgi:hypothetical protein
MQAIHGFDSSVTSHKDRYGGCKGFKDSLVVVNSNLWPRGEGQINASVGMRTATSDILTVGQVRFKEHISYKIALGKSGIGLQSVRPNA